jgi:hypothetical protein
MAMVMKSAHAYTLLLEAVLGAASLAMLWLSFWLRDRRRRHHELQLGRANHLQPRSDLARAQQDGAIVGRLALASVASGLGLTINLASSDVQPASEKDKAVLYRPENAQHFDDKPQIQAEQH